MKPLETNAPLSPPRPGRANATPLVRLPLTKIAVALSALAVVPLSVAGALPAPHRPAAAQTWVVQNCSDHDTDSLRDIIQNPAKAQSGDTVDLSHLPISCSAADAVITLSTGEISVAQDTLYLKGPTAGSVTISGGGASRVLYHSGHGTLGILSLTIADGQVTASPAVGGCLLSYGNVSLDHSRVTGCTVSSSSYAVGGGVAAPHLALLESTVSGNQATSAIGHALGGGVYSDSLTSKYSTVSNNKAQSGAYPTLSGGALVLGSAGIYHSTFYGNTADNGSAIRSTGATVISNSTISGNNGSEYGAVDVASGSSTSLMISNSTIAFNHSTSSSPKGAAVLFSSSQASDAVSLYSSIVANNTIGAGNVPGDVYIGPGHGILKGGKNLVIATNSMPPAGVITLMEDPKLGPLQLNGGTLRTHQLLPGSPAIGAGDDTMSFPPNDPNTADQRGPGYPRTTTIGGNTTVDMGAVQHDTIFVDGFK